MTTPRAERLPDLAVLFPVRAWLRHPALGAGTTWAFVALVAVPPAALALFPGASGTLALSIVLAAYVASVWFLLLRALVRPRGSAPGSWRRRQAARSPSCSPTSSASPRTWRTTGTSSPTSR